MKENTGLELNTRELKEGLLEESGQKISKEQLKALKSRIERLIEVGQYAKIDSRKLEGFLKRMKEEMTLEYAEDIKQILEELTQELRKAIICYGYDEAIKEKSSAKGFIEVVERITWRNINKEQAAEVFNAMSSWYGGKATPANERECHEIFKSVTSTEKLICCFSSSKVDKETVAGFVSYLENLEKQKEAETNSQSNASGRMMNEIVVEMSGL